MVPRTRVAAFLERNAALPLRFLTGPAGTGKTAALVMYLAARERGAYVSLKNQEAPETLRERLAAAVGSNVKPKSLKVLLAALAASAPCEIAIDDIDRATPETLEELGELIAAAPDGVAFLYAARSRATIDARRLLASGLAAMLDAAQLSFDADELARLCEMQGVGYAGSDVARLREETDGWPVVAGWVVRDAAESGTGLAGAYDRWRTRNGRLFKEFLAHELRSTDDALCDMLHAALGPAASEDRERLAVLEAHGLFVYYADDTYRPYRVVRQFEIGAASGPQTPKNEQVPLLVVRMFGRFEAEIGDRRIEWVRRREAQIFKYLLLKANGLATRAELRGVFWPEADYHLATQSLRTASSNIRKAIATIVGYANVDRYFVSRGDIGVNLENAVIDVRRFAAHVHDGDVEHERGCLPEAFAHYRAAESLYSGELLSGEYPEPWYAARADACKELYAGVLEKIAAHHAASGRLRHAREYAERVGELRSDARLVQLGA
jgi:hypothetical protein